MVKTQVGAPGVSGPAVMTHPPRDCSPNPERWGFWFIEHPPPLKTRDGERCGWCGCGVVENREEYLELVICSCHHEGENVEPNLRETGEESNFLRRFCYLNEKSES